MIRLIKISKPRIQELIELSYRDDSDLLEKYHVAQFTLHEAVVSTMGMINEMSEQRELTYYKVLNGTIPIGYLVVFESFLYSFGINVKFRTKNILSEWWNCVIKVLGSRFICALYINNIRAIEYLKRRGMKIMQEDNISVTLVKF